MTRSPPITRWCGAFIGLLLLTLTTFCASAASPKRVLILDPFGRNVAPFTTAVSSFRNSLAREFGEPVDIYDLPLELARFAGPEGEKQLVGFLEGRLKEQPVDLVVSVGTAGMQFAARHRGQLFANTPVLVLASEPRIMSPELLKTNATAVTQRVSLPGMVEDILQLQPQTTNIVMVLGASALERFWAEQCRREFQVFTNRVGFTWVNDLTLEQILKHCATLPPNSFVLHVLFIVDAAGVPCERNEALVRLHASANAPVFAYYESEFGLGSIGGRLFQDLEVGAEAGRTAVRILRGERPEKIPPKVFETTTPTYDWRELRRWNISEARLPAGSVIQFRQPTFWEHYRWLVIGTALFCLLQAALIVGLWVNRSRRKQGEAEATLLAEISSKFVNLPPVEVDREIVDAERRICEALNLDFVALWQWSDQNPGSFTLTHIYSALEGAKPPTGTNSRDIFPWAEQQMRAGRIIALASLDDLPKEAARDRDSCRKFGLKSNLTIPLSVGGQPAVGALGLNTLRTQRGWPAPMVKRLEVVAQIFANALARKRADQALRESEARLNLAADSAEAGLWVLDCGKQVFWATEKCRALFGYSPEEVISMERFKASVHPEDWDLVQGSLERAVQTGEPVNVEYRIDAGEGRARWITSRGRPQFTPAGKADRVLGVSIDITERKRAEEAFRASEARLAAGSEMAGLGYYEADYGACSCFLDDRIRAISGVPAELKEGLDPVQFWSEHIHPEDRQLVQDERQKLHHGNVDWISVEYRYLHPALGQRWLHHSTRTAERRAGGAGMRVFGVVRDITEYKKLAEEQAEDSRFGNLIADLSSKFVNLPAAEVDNAIEEAQRRVCEFLGLGLSSLWQPVIETSGEYRLTHDYRSAGGPQIKHMSAKDNFPWCLRRLLAGEVIAVSSMNELPPEAARDQEVWRHLGIKTSLTVPMSTGGASAIGFLSFNDLTRERDWPVKLVNRLQLVAQIFANALARKVADQQLRESEEVNRATFEQAGVGIAHVGTDGHWLQVNDKLCAILGYARGELMQMTFQSITHPDDLETDLELMRQTLSGGISTYSLAKRYFRKDKSMVWANLTVSLVRNEAGGPKHFISVVEDITERKQAEASVLQQRAELAHLSRVAMLGELSGAMAHELNQPLTAILSNAQAAQRFLAGEEADLGEVRDILADIVTEDKRAGEIIRRLRLLLKKGEVQHQPLNVNEVVLEVLKLVRSDLVNQNVTTQTELAPGLPVVHGDRVQLQQVLLNLVMNACEAMAGTEKSARQLTIRTDRSEDGSVCVSVSDCGPGIVPEKLEQIFESFYTTKAQGMGLGLTVCRTIITAHNGKLWATNNRAEGATLHFALPVGGEGQGTRDVGRGAGESNQ